MIGEPGANAPHNGDAMLTLGAQLNLNPALVSTQDDCARNTFEGFMVVGVWTNPGSYASGVIGVAPPLTVAQVLFPTSVISFSGYIVPNKVGDAPVAGKNFDLIFPTLPTSLAVCLTSGTPSNATTIAFGTMPTTAAAAPFLPTGSGNPADPSVRAIGPQTGTFGERIVLKHGATVVATINPAGCAIAAATALPNFACGDG